MSTCPKTGIPPAWVIAALGLLAVPWASSAGAQCVEEQKITAWDGVSDEQFANAVGISGDVAILGMELDGDNGYQSGSAFLFVFDGTSWVPAQKLTPLDGAPGDHFGIDLGISGGVAVVGARGVDEAGLNAGAAYLYHDVGTAWVQLAKLLASDAGANDQFGIAVDIAGDVVVVGANLDDDGATNAGAAYVFRFDGSEWIEEAKLVASDAMSSDHFGIAVAAATDTIVVGARLNDQIADDAGAAYVYRYANGQWTEQQKIWSPDGDTWDRFGCAVDVDGDALIVGAYLHDAGDMTNAGMAYVFAYDGNTWSLEAQLHAADGQPGDQSGVAVALRGTTAVVGSSGANNGIYDDAGAARIFEFDGSAWVQQDTLFASDGVFFDYFGNAVAIGADDVLVAAHSDSNPNGPDSGAAYFFSGCVDSAVCVSADDCADGDDCTQDVCDDGTCLHDNACACLSDDDCDDDNACTADFCNAGACLHAEVSCADSDACTVDDCDPALGCTHAALLCGPGLQCVNGACQPSNCAAGGVCAPCEAQDGQCKAPADCCSGNCRGGVCR